MPIDKRTVNELPQDNSPRNKRKSDRHLVFTPQRIDQLMRAGAHGYYYDLRCRGLAIRFGKSKAAYIHTLRSGGTFQRHTLGNVQSMLLADARQAVMAAAGALAKGQMLAPLLGRPGSALERPVRPREGVPVSRSRSRSRHSSPAAS